MHLRERIGGARMYDESKGRGGDAGADEARVTAEGDAGPAKPPEPRSEEAARQEELARIAPAALDAALAALAAPAFVVRSPGTVLRANARGAALLAAEPARVLAALRDGTARGPLAPVRYDIQGATHFVAVLPDIEDQAARRAPALAARWGLTPRQTGVLALVAEGDTNRSIAHRLGCSEKTIELHVSALLAKTRCVSRSQLVAAFWTDPSARRGRGPDAPE